MKKAQMGLMEYIILTFFIVLIIIVMVFFLIGYQITQSSLQKGETSVDRALSLTKQVYYSPLFVKSGGVFDDSKLTSLKTMGNVCPKLEEMFGDDWFFELTVLNEDNEVIPCEQSTYPFCNYWSFCQQQDRNFIVYDLPVNVHRSIGMILSDSILQRTDIGLLRVGVYVK